MSKNIFCLVYVTVGNISEAKSIARLALSKNLCACANIFPEMISIFKWQEKINSDNEVNMFLKTIDKKYNQLEELIRKNHSYDTPCIIKINISDGNKKFLNWVEESIK